MSKTMIYMQPENICDSAYRHEKEKLKRQQRRISEKRLNKKRKKESGLFNNQYYVKDSRRARNYKEIIVPEEKVDIGYYKWISRPERYLNEDWVMETHWYKVLVFIKTGEEIIPEHTVRKRAGWNHVPIKPYLKKYSFSKKNYKKIAARRFRRTTGKDELFKGGLYKKNYDLWWEIY